jgi:NADH:ubiquinone oxidoreductase subunit C
VETNEKLTKIFNSVSDSLLEKARFGRSESTSYWINSLKLTEICEKLKEQAGYDWLENLSCIQVDETLVFTYFLRTRETGQSTILRVSVDIPQSASLTTADASEVDLPSVSNIWKSAETFEPEIALLFGVRFSSESLVPETPRSWSGFPLRKDFVFPDTEKAGGFR